MFNILWGQRGISIPTFVNSNSTYTSHLLCHHKIYENTMNEKTWPRHRSETPNFTTIKFPNPNPKKSISHSHHFQFTASPPSSSSHHRHPTPTFAVLPNDLLLKIASTFTLPHLQSLSLVCTSWRDALKPLREAMLFLRWGKKYKHGKGGVKVDMGKAIEMFMKGALRGSTLAMVDAGLCFWESGRRQEGVEMYRKAAELGDVAGMCNLGISYLQAESPNTKEAVKWLHKASVRGYVRGQYQLAHCFHRGIGTYQNMSEAARWYLRAAEGGYVRAMHNVSLCYSLGRGFMQNHRQSRKWMKLAADHGHRKAQFEHGLTLFSEGQMTKAVVYLELAGRGGERAADHVKNVILQQLSPPSREQVMALVDSWRALPSSR